MKRKQTTTSTASKRVKKTRAERPDNVTKMQWQALDPEALRKKLNKLARKYEKQVDDDWHDGWEEQEQTLQKWASAFKRNLQAILTVGIGKQLAFHDCHSVLMTIADSWRDLDANCPRGETREMIGDGAPIRLNLPWDGVAAFLRFDSLNNMHPLHDACGFVWRALLRDAANRVADRKVSDEDLLQAVKDASDNGIKLHSRLAPDKHSSDANKYMLVERGAAPCAKALDLIVEQKDRWVGLQCRITEFEERPSIDRRYEGTPERRTRDYHLREDELELWPYASDGPYDGFRLL